MAGEPFTMSIGGGEPRRIEKSLFRAANNVEDVSFLVPPHSPRVEDVTLLRRVPKREALGKPRKLRVPAQMPEGEPVKGRDAQLGSGYELKRRRNAGLHFIRGLPAEGQGQDAPAIDALPHQMNKAARKCRSLARTRAGQNKLDIAGPGGGTMLYRIERIYLIDHVTYDSPQPSDPPLEDPTNRLCHVVAGSFFRGAAVRSIPIKGMRSIRPTLRVAPKLQ
jgi:hypothetical protein